MAVGDVRDQLLYWTQSGQDAERKRTKDIREGLNWQRELKHTIASRFPKGKAVTTLEPKWWTGVAYQTTVTATLTSTTMVFSGYLFKEAITEDALRQFIKAGTILERSSDGMKVQLSTTQSDITYSTYTAINCVAYGTSTLSNDSTAVEYTILATPITDYEDNFMPRSLDVGLLKCGHQTVNEGWESPWLATKIKYDAIKDPRKTNIAELIKKINADIMLSLLRMEPVYSAGSRKFGYEAQRSTICGALTWCDIMYEAYPNDNVHFSKSGLAIDPDDINRMVCGLEDDEGADFNVGDWIIGVDPVTARYINRFGVDNRIWYEEKETYGHRVTHFKAENGKLLPVIKDKHMRPGVAAVMDCNAFEWYDVAGDEIQTYEIAQDHRRVDEVMITGTFVGTAPDTPRTKIAVCSGLPTTFA